MRNNIERVLIDRATIAKRVEAMALQIAEDMRASGDPDRQLTIIAILTGSLIFLSDLIRHMPFMLRLKLITVSSYPGKAMSTQGPRIEGNMPESFAGQHVVILDDILDSGKTIEMVRGLVQQRDPASIRICALLRKQIPSAMAVKAEYVGFEIADEFVVGYGLDYDGYYRNLPDIVTLKAEAIR